MIVITCKNVIDWVKFGCEIKVRLFYGYGCFLYAGASWELEDTWYAVPRDAVVAFEDAVRVNGYGGEAKPIGELWIYHLHF